MSRDPSLNEPDRPERRGAGRFESNRPARFSDARGLGPLRTGRVVDMSATGLRLETSHPPEPSDDLEIELESEHDGEIEMVRGTVVHADALDDHKFTVGVQTRFDIQREPLIVTSARVLDENVAASKVTVPTSELNALVRPKRSTRKLRMALVGAAAALLLLALWGLAQPESSSRADALGNGWARSSDLTDEVILPRPPSPSASHQQSSQTARKVSTDRTEILPEPIVADEKPAELDSLASSEISRGVNGGNGAKPSEPGAFITRFDAAQAAFALGDAPGAIEGLRAALADASGVSAIWTERAEASLAAFSAGTSVGLPAQPLDTEVTVDTAPPIAEDAPMLIEVDLSDFVLHVRRNDAIIRSFPVGLGLEGATAPGRYTIKDKIVNPDWYDRGRTVPAGSEENPLGSRWMGLAQDGQGTGLGIHPTAEGESLEQPQSRGCVRMSAADAEALFRLAPAGTPVWIHN